MRWTMTTNVDGRDQAIRALEARLSRTRLELDKLRRTFEEDVRSLERSLELLREEDGQPPPADEPNPSSLAALGPQDAVVKFLREHPGKPYKPSVLSREFIRLGVKPKTARNYPTVLRTACKVLVKKGLVAVVEVGGRSAFRLAEGTLK
jgi:hypothetical protein